MRLVSETFEDVGDGEPGELLLRGPQMFGGYLHDSERTLEVMAPGGWLRTGDLATPDGEGLFAICGRRKEMYISGGENVFPGEVESALTAKFGAPANGATWTVRDSYGYRLIPATLTARSVSSLEAEEVFIAFLIFLVVLELGLRVVELL